jgi:hypothetical protein
MYWFILLCLHCPVGRFRGDVLWVFGNMRAVRAERMAMLRENSKLRASWFSF